MICFVNQVFMKLNILKAFQKCGAKVCFGGAKLVPLHHI